MHDASLSRAELLQQIGRPSSPLLLDVRRGPAREASGRSLVGSLRCAPDHLDRWWPARASRPVVVYCVHGHEVSQQAAQRLREAGWPVRHLEGGLEDGEPLPTWRWRPDLGVTGEARSHWVLPAATGIESVACAWLVQRFIDPDASMQCAPRGADAVWSFDGLLQAFDLRWPPLDRMAQALRSAASTRPSPHPPSQADLAACDALFAVSVAEAA